MLVNNGMLFMHLLQKLGPVDFLRSNGHSVSKAKSISFAVSAFCISVSNYWLMDYCIKLTGSDDFTPLQHYISSQLCTVNHTSRAQLWLPPL